MKGQKYHDSRCGVSKAIQGIAIVDMNNIKARRVSRACRKGFPLLSDANLHTKDYVFTGEFSSVLQNTLY
jgi:hypothetical protein